MTKFDRAFAGFLTTTAIAATVGHRRRGNTSGIAAILVRRQPHGLRERVPDGAARRVLVSALRVAAHAAGDQLLAPTGRPAARRGALQTLI